MPLTSTGYAGKIFCASLSRWRDSRVWRYDTATFVVRCPAGAGKGANAENIRGCIRLLKKHDLDGVLCIEADGNPVGADDAADARFWPIDLVLDGELPIAGAHMEILRDWLSE